MSSELVKVVNGGAGGVASLDPTAMLSTIRTELEGDSPPLMNENQSFMIAGAPLQPDDEAITQLSEALATAQSGPPVLTVGDPSVVIPSNEKWVQLERLYYFFRYQSKGLSSLKSTRKGNKKCNAKNLFNVASLTEKPPQINSTIS